MDNTNIFEDPYKLFSIGDRIGNKEYRIYTISRKTLEVEPSNFFGKDAVFTSYNEAKKNFEEMRAWKNIIGRQMYKNATLVDYDLLLDLSCTLQLKAGKIKPGIRPFVAKTVER